MSQVLDNEWQSLVANAICHAAEMTKHSIASSFSQYERPSVLYRPSLYLDGSQWCALYGSDLQSGGCGFGDSPEKAMADFDADWCKTLPAPKE